MARVRNHRDKWQVPYRDPMGRERSAGVYTRKTEADRAKREIETDLDRGEWLDPTPGKVTTVATFAPVWISGRVDLKPSTRAGYEQILSARILAEYGSMPISAFTHTVLQGWVARMVSEGLSPNRVRNVFNVMRGLLGGAVAHRIIRADPAAGVELPKAHKVEQRYLTPDQIRWSPTRSAPGIGR